MELSFRNRLVINLYQKGYRTENGKIFNPKGKELKFRIDSRGYPFIKREIDGKKRQLPLHKLTAFQKFGDAIFKKGIQVRHLNSNKLDFSFQNIEIGTHRDNKMDFSLEERKKIGFILNFKKRRFSKEQVEQIRSDYLTIENKKGFCTRMGKIYNINSTAIKMIIENKTYNRWK